MEVLAKEGPRIADRGIEAWRCRVWSAGGGLRYGGMEIWRSGGAVGVGIEVWGSRALCSDMEIWRYGPKEDRDMCRDVEAWRDGGLEARCRRSDVEVWSSGGSLQV